MTGNMNGPGKPQGIRIPFEEVLTVLKGKLLKRNYSKQDAELSARLFTETSCDGVYSHGLNRFPLHIQDMERGFIKVGNRPELIAKNGALETWNGRLGPGNLNAYRCTEHAVALAREHGIACVALSHTNHWLRGGSYGWQAADQGCLAMMWSNTIGNMPPWGGSESTIGNNPFVMAVPREKGHVVLDFAQSMFSYGKLSLYRKKQESLPFAGGYDLEGRLTSDPAAIEASMRPLPAGMWKGSGLSIMLDLFATILSAGQSTMEISREGHEYAVSQVFIAIAPGTEIFTETRKALLDRILEYTAGTSPIDSGSPVRYPGQKTLEIRSENREKGIPVDEDVWRRICSL